MKALENFLHSQAARTDRTALLMARGATALLAALGQPRRSGHHEQLPKRPGKRVLYSCACLKPPVKWYNPAGRVKHCTKQCHGQVVIKRACAALVDCGEAATAGIC
jgi:hypothetical protein